MTQVYEGEGVEPDAEWQVHCAAIADAVRVFARGVARARGAGPACVLDGLVSAYANEALDLIGPAGLLGALRSLVRFAEDCALAQSANSDPPLPPAGMN